MTRGRRSAAGLLLLLSAGCGLPTDDQARPLDIGTPGPTVESTAATPQPPGQRSERLFLVRDGRLVPVSRNAELVTPRRALQDLLAGPSQRELELGLTTSVPTTAQITLRGVEAGVAVVALEGDLTSSGRSDQVLALAQIVATLDASPGVGAVRFVQDGERLPVPGSDGVLTDLPLTVEDYRSLLAG